MLTILYRFILTPKMCLLLNSNQPIWKVSTLLLALIASFFIAGSFSVMGLVLCMIAMFVAVFLQVAVIEFVAQSMDYPSRFLSVIQWYILSLYPLCVIPIFLSLSKISVWIASQQLLAMIFVLGGVVTLQVGVIRFFYSCSLARGILLWAVPFLIFWGLVVSVSIGMVSQLGGFLLS